MTVYFSGSARDIIKNEALYTAIIESIWDAGGIIANSWVPAAAQRGTLPETEEWWERISLEAFKGIEDSDIVIVEASGISTLGVGYELANALNNQKPTLLLIEEEKKNSSYGTGISHTYLKKHFYSPATLKSEVSKFVRENIA